MRLAAILVVAHKELVDGLRDRRSIYTVLAVTLLGPLLVTLMLGQLARQSAAASHIRLPVAGIERAPALGEWLARQPGVDLVPAPRDAAQAVRGHDDDVVLVIGDGFARDFSRSHPAPVEIYYDSTRSPAQPNVNRALDLLARFNAEQGALRLIARGLSPEVAAPLEVRQVDVTNIEQRAATLLGIVLMLVAMSIVMSGMQLATDATAGERERRSLEPLLLSPVPRWQLVAGKFAAASVMALLGMVAALAALWIVLSRLSLEDLGIRVSLGEDKLALLVAALAPLALLAPAIQVYLSCFARTFKEAQSYMLILVIPIVATGALFKLYPEADQPWLQAVPVVAQYLLGTDILGGKSVSAAAIALSFAECGAAAAIFLWLATRLIRTEKVVFGR